MKTKLIGLMTLALMGTTTAFGQDTDTKNSYFSIGPVAGVGHSWMSDMNDQTFKPSAYLGVGMLYSKDAHWGFGGLVTASHEGFSQKVYKFGNEYVNSIDPTYLRATPRVYYFFGDYGDNVRPKLYVGPSVGVKVAEDNYINEPAPMTDGIYMMPEGDVFNTVDFGANVGAGANIKLSRVVWLNLDADYYHGFTNATIFNNKNRSVRANVGVLFGI